MNRIKFLSIFIITLIFSCSTEDTNNEQLENFNVKESYEKIVYGQGNSQNRNSSNSNGIEMDSYEALNDDQKADLWNYKYQLFENSNNLNDTQIQILNDVKEFSRVAIINGSYDEETISNLDQSIQKHFTIDQFVDLMFYLDNPSVLSSDSNTYTRLDCFWCNETVPGGESPCYLNDNGVVVKTIEFRRRRLFIGWSTGFADVPCSDSEIWDQYDDIF